MNLCPTLHAFQNMNRLYDAAERAHDAGDWSAYDRMVDEGYVWQERIALVTPGSRAGAVVLWTGMRTLIKGCVMPACDCALTRHGAAIEAAVSGQLDITGLPALRSALAAIEAAGEIDDVPYIEAGARSLRAWLLRPRLIRA